MGLPPWTKGFVVSKSVFPRGSDTITIKVVLKRILPKTTQQAFFAKSGFQRIIKRPSPDKVMTAGLEAC
jgi:hypothetical protein